MMQQTQQHIQNTWTAIFILLATSAIGCGLVVLSGTVRDYWPLFLIWNLFLAWIPLGFAWIVRLRRLSFVPFAGLTIAWLLFFPNAPYILTDLTHLGWMGQHSSWLTTSIYITFALTGLFVGLTSLAWMHAEMRERGGVMLGWVFVLISLGASGFGVYIGRFLRFDSWDILTEPSYLVNTVFQTLFSPNTFVHAWGFSFTFALLTAFCYVMTQHVSQPQLPQLSNATQK